MPKIKRCSRAPNWKIYTTAGEYVASCHYVEDAAAVVALYDDGATIRWGHPKKFAFWTQGIDGEAGDSFDAVAEVCHAKLENYRKERGWI